MKKPPAVILALLVASSIAVPPPAKACPAVPTLWKLVGEAELIVLARVESIELAPPDTESDDTGHLYRRDVAVLRVLETWKGPSRAEVRVQFFAAPWARYREGEVVLAFLESGERRAADEVESWSYEPDAAAWLEAGIPPEELLESQQTTVRMRKEVAIFAEWAAGRWFDLGPIGNEIDRPAESDRAGLKDLVELARRLQTGGSDEGTAWREWLVAAAERRVTRGESVHALLWSSRGAPVSLMERNGEEEEEETEDGEPAPDPLTDDELARLAAGFVREPSLGYPDVVMLKLLAGYADLEVDRAAAAVIEAGLLQRPIPGWVTPMVDEALKRYGDDFSARIGRDDRDPRGRPIYTGEGEYTLPTIWEVARRELGIPEVLPAVAPVREAASD